MIIILSMRFPAKPLFGAALWAFFKRRHRKPGQYLQPKTGMAEDIVPKALAILFEKMVIPLSMG